MALGGADNLARSPELRTKLLWTLGLLCAYRIGVHIPVPGVDGVISGLRDAAIKVAEHIALLSNFAVNIFGIEMVHDRQRRIVRHKCRPNRRH